MGDQSREISQVEVDSYVLHKCSSGLALQGVLLTNQLEDQLKIRQRLIEVPEKVIVTKPSQSEERTRQFSLKGTEEYFKEKIIVLGYGIALSPVPVYGKVTICKTESEKAGQNGQAYLSTVKCSVVETATYSFRRTSLKLAKEVIQDLHKLLETLKVHGKASVNVYEECAKFFEKYGSHANLGPLTYGGHLLYTCYSREFSGSKIGLVKDMQQDVFSSVNDNITLTGFDESEVHFDRTLFEDKYTSDVVKATQLKVKVTGGSLKTLNISQWKNELVSNKSSWVLVNRGKKLIAVWDIIKFNYEQEFRPLIKVLKASWEKMTNLMAELNWLELLSYDVDDKVQEVSKWNEEKKVTNEDIKQRLDHLLRVKRDIFDKRVGLKVWINSYLMCPTVQTFLLSVVNAGISSSHSETIIAIMRELVEQEELDQLNMEDHPSMKKVSDLLYKSSRIDLQGFNRILKEALEQMKREDSNKYITKSIDKELRRLRSHYQNKYESILIAILIYRFQCSLNTMELIPLSVIELEILYCSFFQETKRLKKYETNQTCCLLLIAIEQKPLVKYFKNFMMSISQMLKEVQPPCKKELLQRLNRALHADSDETLSGFKHYLESLLKSPGLTIPRQSSITNLKSLKVALQTKKNESVFDERRSSMLKEHPIAHDLFIKLGISDMYPKKLSLIDALCIRPKSLNGNPPTDLKQLPNLVLHKLMSYDLKCRSDFFKKQKDMKDIKDDDYVDSDDDYVDSDDEDINSLSIHDQQKDSFKGVHPVDCLLSLILCSDDFLCQDLFSRLAKCQIAVPFLLPDPFTKQLTLRRFAMRSIIKEWKVINADEQIDEFVHSVIDYPVPIISFVRFGTQQNRGSSKSKILNMVISDSNHNFYFHRNCLVEQCDCILGEGLVDICWYLPTGKLSDTFNSPIAFLNLHGDARRHNDQIRFLSQISFMCFVLISEENLIFDDKTMESLSRFNKSPGGISILNDVKEKPKTLKKAFSNSTVINLASKTSAEITDIIQRKIKMKLAEGLNVFIPIREVCVGKDIALDEDDKNYKECSEHASKLMSIITGHKDKKISVKEAMLPLQGENWKTWAACDKELHRQTKRENRSVHEYTAMIEAEKAAIRSKQLKHLDSLTPLMDLFIKSLLKFGGSSNRILRNYYLQSLNLDINSHSRESISKMQQQYQSKKKALSLLQTKSAIAIKLKEELEILQGNIINFSFGLEHLFRELGQVYEVALESEEYDESLSQLPKAAAELLIDGYPLEVMDGDAAHVQVNWTTAVLNETVKIFKDSNDPKVFVLSVLGLQSTGKSTMLNATFGVQFNVSAGRCTRGAFMQLLPLDKEVEKTTGCSYVLVVDTEGLRAPELEPLNAQKHDNELATFVIGLANMTLINIYGEVPGDMDDILQTSVHAFLRMTEVKYHPSCQFVHQNASANIKNEAGHAKFIQKLNQFTLTAAREEQCEGQYQSFNDVIHLDPTDFHYFPGLWKGDPPMAPVNEGYSNAAQFLKRRLIERICDKAKSSDLRLSLFKVKITDLWNTLLKEKFIFSFKNTLEVTAYNSLETSYSQWAWTLQEGMLKWEQEAENEITTLKPDENISDLVTQKIYDVKEYAMNIYQPLREKMEDFFKGNLSEILIQWKADFDFRLKKLSDELSSNAKDHCKNLLSSRKAISQFKMKRMRDAEYIKERVQHQLKMIKKEQEELIVSLEKRILKPHQLAKLLKRNLFSTQKLKMYVEQHLITLNQENEIKALCRDQLTASSINRILVGGILSEEQVKSILKKTRQTDEELMNDFESIWKEMTSSIDSTLSFKSSVPVEKMVVAKLHEYVEAKGWDGKLISRLKEATLREWGTRYDFIPEERKHYQHRNHRRETDNKKDANEITKKVFGCIGVCVQEMVKKDTNFNAAFTIKLLNLVESEITEQSEGVNSFYTFTTDYKLDMYLIACGYALPMFEKMADFFREKNDPLLYLEREVKGPEFIKFKNQYHQREVEEAVADTLCAYLEEPIKIQIGKSLGREMVTKMKSSAQHFSSKMALKVKVLTDLLEENVFENYMIYVENVQRCLEGRIHNYTIEYCDEKYCDEPGSSTRLQQAAKEEVTRLLNVAKELVIEVKVDKQELTDEHNETENKVKIEDWLSSFSKNQKFRSKLGVCLEPKDLLSGYDGSQKIDLGAFIKRIKDGLKELEKALHIFYQNVKCEEEMVHWKNKPHDILKSLIGCTAQCPFCGEQCDLLDPDHAQKGPKHKTEVHRMDCLAGWRCKHSQVMVSTGFCPEMVDSEESFYKQDGTVHPYRRFQEVYEDWSIPPDRSSKNCLYWKWFVGTYKDKIAKSFAAKPPSVPSEWTALEKPKIVNNLKQVYNI